jgi:hypothetical protein
MKVKKEQTATKPSKTTRMQVLELIGLSPEPLFPTEIHDTWFDCYSPYRKLNLEKKDREHTHIFKIVKDLAGHPGSVKFLKTKIGYTKIAQNQIDSIRKEYGIMPEQYPPDSLVGILVMNPTFDQNKKMNAELEIDRIMNDKKNQVYSYRLNFRGFLQYLRWLYEYGRINTKKIDTIRKNLIVLDPELSFLHYFEAFDINGRTNILIEISEQLQNALDEMTEEYLQREAMFRLYNDILFWDSFYDRDQFRAFRKPNVKDDMLHFKEFREKILAILIPLEENWVQRMKVDKQRTKESIVRFYQSRQN